VSVPALVLVQGLLPASKLMPEPELVSVRLLPPVPLNLMSCGRAWRKKTFRRCVATQIRMYLDESTLQWPESTSNRQWDPARCCGSRELFQRWLALVTRLDGGEKGGGCFGVSAEAIGCWRCERRQKYGSGAARLWQRGLRRINLS
jgi:hypothetical protein